jgi:hypothetical protein
VEKVQSHFKGQVVDLLSEEIDRVIAKCYSMNCIPMTRLYIKKQMIANVCVLLTFTLKF